MPHAPKQLGNAKVSIFSLNSTGAISAMGVVQLDSTGGIVTGGSGSGSTQVSVREIQTSSGASVMDSTEGAIKVNVVAGAAGGSTEVTVRQSTVGALRAAVYQSTAADLTGSVVQGSTVWPVQVSTIAGAVIVRSSAANALQTAYQSTYTDFNTLSRIADRDQSSQVAAISNVTAPPSTTYGLVVRLPAPLVDSTNNALRVFQAASSVVPSTTVNVSSVGGLVRTYVQDSSGAAVHPGDSDNNALRVNVVAGAAGGSTVATISRVQDSSNGGVPVGDSENNAIRVNVVAGAAAGSTIVTVSTGSVNIAAIQDSSNALVKPGDSDNNAIRVNVVAGAAGGSTLMTVRQSTVGDLRAAVYQSTAADLNVTVANLSTTANVSSLAGRVLVDQNSTVWPVQVSSVAGRVLVDQNSTVWVVQLPSSQSIQVKNSTIGDLLASVQQNSTVWVTQPRLHTSSGGAVEGSTTAPAANTIGLHVRQVFPTLLSTTVVITSTNSTAIYPLISSAAGVRHKVYAYFVGSTHTSPSTLLFCSSASGSGFDHWPVNFGSGSSGITGANLAVTPPGYIFAGIVANALNVKIEGGSSAASTVIVRIGISYFSEA